MLLCTTGSDAGARGQREEDQRHPSQWRQAHQRGPPREEDRGGKPGLAGRVETGSLDCLSRCARIYDTLLTDIIYVLLSQAFTAALQTQWSWILQLCCCIEAHLKENTAYYQVKGMNGDPADEYPIV